MNAPNARAAGDRPVIALRPVEDADLDTFFAHLQDPVAVHQAAFVHRDPADRAAFDAHWARIRADARILNRAILADGVLVGHVASFVMDDRREVTYWIDRAAWGRGVATAALRLFLAEVDPVRPIYGTVAADNDASRRVLEKCGFRPDGEGRAFANARREDIGELYFRLDAPPPAR